MVSFFLHVSERVIYGLLRRRIIDFLIDIK